MLNKGWIDIHAHVLPGVDDGARDWEESRALLKLAYDQGIRHIIATPHYTYKQDVEKLQDLGSRLDLEAKSIAQDYGVSLGQEIMYFESLTAYLDQNKALTLAGSRYVLVDVYKRQGFSYVPEYFISEQELTDALQDQRIDAALTSNLRTLRNEWILNEMCIRDRCI